MTDKKPKLDEDLIERIAQRLFDSYAKDWAGDHDTRLWDEIDEEEAREWREEATELLTPAYEQGKLDLFKEVEQLICGTSTIDALEGGVIGLDCYYLNADRFNRLKSQLSKSEGAK